MGETPETTIMVANHRDPAISRELHWLQQASYIVERDLIEYPDFPPLRETPDDIQQSQETFLACQIEKRLAGAVSFAKTDDLIDIGRMLVHPDFFRKGIASRLLRAVEEQARPGIQLTVSTAEKNVPAVRLYEKHGYVLTKRTVLPDGLALVRFYKRHS